MKEVTLKKIDISAGNSQDLSVKVSQTKDISPKLVNMVVDWQLRGRRAASANVKEMSEISGTTKKPYKQKGTGNARQGSKRSVQYVGGRTCHGPKGRVFDFSFPKKSKAKALEMVIKEKFLSGSALIFSNSENVKKTKQLQKVIKDNKIRNLLILYTEGEASLSLPARNLKNCKASQIEAINVYDILSYDNLLVSEAAYKKSIENILVK